MVTFYRRLPSLDYQKPGNLRETLELLDENREAQYLLYAGGTDVIPKLKVRILYAGHDYLS